MIKNDCVTVDTIEIEDRVIGSYHSIIVLAYFPSVKKKRLM